MEKDIKCDCVPIVSRSHAETCPAVETLWPCNPCDKVFLKPEVKLVIEKGFDSPLGHIPMQHHECPDCGEHIYPFVKKERNHPRKEMTS